MNTYLEPKPLGFFESAWEAIKAVLQAGSSEVYLSIFLLLLFLAALVAFVHWTVPKGQFDSWQRHTHRHHYRRHRRHRDPEAFSRSYAK
jgi:uncharacterized ion transporter superfamily protein YfcC